ncbi:MAG: SDR family oxidoreductase [Ketobacteraceae bacterium]|nr:SDR family oxidoreductase [Ketobacteraceae bacterium]
MSDFINKTYLVTGATSGIGRATALALLKAGAFVGVNHYNDHDGFDDLVRELKDQCPEAGNRIIELPGDVSKRQAVEQMVAVLVEHTQRLDGLINNAGISQIKPFIEITDEDWDQLINTDLKSVFLCCQAAIPHLQKTGGTIVNVASELALTGRARFAHYTAAKGGVISLTRSLAREFAPEIRVNGIAPGPTKTPMLDAEAQVPGHQEPVDDIPMKRVATAEEIADSILFLASEKAGYFCGEIISPNGGSVMR